MNVQSHVLVEELVNLFGKSIILTEYDKLNSYSQSVFRKAFSKECPETGINDIVNRASELELNNMIGWMQMEAYNNSDEYLNNRYDP